MGYVNVQQDIKSLELNSNEMSVEIIVVIRDALKELSVDFTNVIARRRGSKQFLDLIFTQFT